MKLSHEIVEKIKSVGSADEVLAIAKECNVEITPEEADKYFHQLHLGELDNVSGGGCGDDLPLYRNYTMVHEFFCTNCFRVYPASKCKVMHFDNKDDVAYCLDCQKEVAPVENFVHGKI